ncbi:RICIN domain-containing protein [Photobacterium damselae]|uniref:RICIN domain-containing protein n=1 Tax=Photobacterium damselae TaxID=38293 RepID=UPI0040685CF2
MGLYSCHGQENQRFNYIDGQVMASINTYADRDSNQDYCLDIANNDDYADTEVRMWTCNNTSAQKFKLRYDDRTGKRYLQSRAGYCVSFTHSGAWLAHCNTSDSSQTFSVDNAKKMIHVTYYNDGAYNFTPKTEAHGQVYYSNRYSISAGFGWDRWVSGDITNLFIGGWPATLIGGHQHYQTVSTKAGDSWRMESKGTAFGPWIEVYKTGGF